LKTSVEVGRIRRACRVAELCLRHLAPMVRPGTATRAFDAAAEAFLREHGAASALKGYRGFPSHICVSVNNVAAHGIPSGYVLEHGDVVSLDITVAVEGWNGDAAWTFLAGKGAPDARRLLRAAWAATAAGIAAVKPGGRIGDIGSAIQRTAGRFGCTVIEDYVGHGIGRAMHEDPMIPNFGQPDTGLRIVPGMVFTVEPMLNLGNREVRVSSDGWTLVTEDDSFSAQFEHTVAVFRDRTEVLTMEHPEALSLDFPPSLGYFPKKHGPP
jgi:methionyl aminopeptidase